MSGKQTSSTTSLMTQADAARIQSTQVSELKVHLYFQPSTNIHSKAKGGGDMTSGGFAARAQAAAAHNATAGKTNAGQASGSGNAGSKK